MQLPGSVIRSITRELVELTEKPVDGIRVVIDEADVSNIQADLDGPAGTPYESGVFRMKLCLPTDFPARLGQGCAGEPAWGSMQGGRLNA